MKLNLVVPETLLHVMQILQELKKSLVGLLLEELMKCVEIHGTLLKQE